MVKRKSIYIGLGIAMAVAVLFKVYLLVRYEAYGMYPEWIESGIVYVGIGIYAAALADRLEKRCKGETKKEMIVVGGAVSAIALSLAIASAWTHVVYKNVFNYNWDSESVRAMIYSCTVWIQVIMAFCAYIITLLCFRKTPQYINRDIDYGDSIKREVNEDEVSYSVCAPDSELLARLRLLREYEYAKGEARLSPWEMENEAPDEEIASYVVRNGNEPVGYFLVKKPAKDETEICEFFAAGFVDKSFQVLNIALEKYFKSLGHQSVCISDVGSLPGIIANIIEIAVREYTEENYILLGDGKKIGAYDIRFEQ